MTYLIKEKTVPLEKSDLFLSVESHLNSQTELSGFIQSFDGRIWLHVCGCLFIYEKTGVLWREYVLHDKINEVHVSRDGKALVFTDKKIYALNAGNETVKHLLIDHTLQKWTRLQNGNLVLLLSDGYFRLYDPDLQLLCKSHFAFQDINTVIYQNTNTVLYLGERFSDNAIYYVQNIETGLPPNTKSVLDHRVWNIESNDSRSVFQITPVDDYCRGIRRLNDRNLFFSMSDSYRGFKRFTGFVYDLEKQEKYPVRYGFGGYAGMKISSFHSTDEPDALMYVNSEYECWIYDTNSGKSLYCFNMTDRSCFYHVDTERKEFLTLHPNLLLTTYDISNGFVYYFFFPKR